MKRISFTGIILSAIAVYLSSCKQKTAPLSQQKPQPQFNNQLTAEEKAGGVMTPEIMWKFGRLGHLPFLPMGQPFFIPLPILILRVKQEEQIFSNLLSAGGDPVQLTTDGGSSPQWFNNGKSIAFVNKGNLCTMNADGSEQKASYRNQRF